MIIAYHKSKKIHFLDYLKNRLARIYPLYFAGIVLASLSLIALHNFNLGDFTLNVLMVQTWFSGKALTLNVPGWSLSIELLFYIIFPFLFNKFYSKMTGVNHYISLAIILIWITTQILVYLLLNQNLVSAFPISKSDLTYFPLIHLNEFLVGNLAGIYFLNRKIEKQNFEIHIFGLLILLILVLKYPIGIDIHAGLLALIFIPLIILIASNNGKMSTLFESKIAVFLGEISFGIYILQYVLWQWVSDYRLEIYFGLNKEVDFTLSFFIRFFLLIFISSVSYLYIEKPLRNQIKKISIRSL
jgi:peptidoglycan/LPS O-acetylase OafA/YrhL